MYSIQLTHPFGLLMSGSTKSGKTTFVKNLLSYVNVMVDKSPENIVYFCAEYQDTFGEIKNLVPGIKFIQSLPDDILDSISLMILWVKRMVSFQNYLRKNHIMVISVWSILYKIYFIIAKNTIQFLSMQVIYV